MGLVIRIDVVKLRDCAVVKVVQEARQYTVGNQDIEPRAQVRRDSEELGVRVTSEGTNHVIKTPLVKTEGNGRNESSRRQPAIDLEHTKKVLT